ncbi:MAG: hypothetical protein VKS61_14345 [Candidatus Sericytochromatia bacterium]|nr:hypothetical protein [Candidatus Sericytochromatia bacterium]
MTPMAPLPPAMPVLPPPPPPPGVATAGPVAAPMAQAPGAFAPPPQGASRSSSGGSLTVDFRGLASLYNAIYTGLKAPALKGLSGSLERAMPLMKRAAAVQAIASGISNGLDLLQGRVGPGTAVSRFANDTLGAFVGGAGAAVLAGVLMGAFGASGLMASVLGVVGGLVGYGLGQSLLQATGIPGLLSRAIHGVLGS